MAQACSAAHPGAPMLEELTARREMDAAIGELANAAEEEVNQVMCACDGDQDDRCNLCRLEAAVKWTKEEKSTLDAIRNREGRTNERA